MRIITEKRIREAKLQWPHAATALDAWHRLIAGNSFSGFVALRQTFPTADLVGELHVFNIGGNKIRLIAGINYRAQILYIKHVLSHTEYDKGKWKE
jgi:mRNA interferase HigB